MILSHGTRCILRKPGHAHDGEEITVERLNENGSVYVHALPVGSVQEYSVVGSDCLHPVEAA